MRPPCPTTTDDQLDEIAALHSLHESYAVGIHARREREIADLKRLASDLLCIIETGLRNPGAMERARRIVRDL